MRHIDLYSDKELFNQIAPERRKWLTKNQYYYHDLKRFFSYNILPEHSVLEIGCGCGDLLASVPSSLRVGVDFSERMIREAKLSHPDCLFMVSDANHLAIRKSFDYIIISDLLGHLPDIYAMLDELHHVANDQTRIIITYYNDLWRPLLALGENIGMKMPEGLQNWIDSHDMQNFLELSGFEVVRHGKRMLFPKNIPFISSFLNKFIANIPLINRLCLVQYTIARLPREKRDYMTTVVVPVRNEAGTIRSALERIPVMGKGTEVIFVEGHSTDNTLEAIQSIVTEYSGKLVVRWTQQDGVGKGDAVRKGFQMAGGEVLIILDGDLSVPPESLSIFYRAIASGEAEFVNGSRLVYPMEDEAMRLLNHVGNKCFSMLFTWLLEQPYKDTLCGTKVLFTKDYLRLAENRSYFGTIDPFGDFDLIFGTTRMNLKMREVAVAYRSRQYGATNIKRWSHGWILLRMALLAAKRIKWI